MNIPHPPFVLQSRSGFSFTPSTGGMDVARPPQHARRRRNRRWIMGSLAALLVAGATYAATRLKPALPILDKSTIWTDTVRRGPMLREVRGLGTLVPEEIRWIAAGTDARVERIVIYPGATVQPDSIVLALSNPELTQTVLDADATVTAAQAKLVNLARAAPKPIARTAIRVRQSSG